MSRKIRVQPAARRRREFAVWATAQTPKIYTVSPNTFAVPPELFATAPEEILIGSLVDGHRYVSPQEEDQEQQDVEESGPWTPPVLPEVEGIPGEPLPELPAEAYGPDAVLLPPPDFAPLDDAPADDEGDGEADEDDPVSYPGAPGPGAHRCGDCGRTYATERGLATHRRQKHPEGN